jgi:hypothetical protein
VAPKALFPDTERTDPEKHRSTESNYEFLQRVDDPTFARVRAVFNDWFAGFAERQEEMAVNDLRRRFEAKGDEQLYGAFWELYLHETLLRLGYEVMVHPESERGTKPDFEVNGPGGRWFMEAMSLFPGYSQGNEPGSVATVIEYVDEAWDPKWRFRLRYVFPGEDSPRKKAVVAEVRAWLDTVDWEVGWTGDMSSSAHPEKDIKVGDWTIGLTAIPMPPEIHGDHPVAPMVAFHRSISGYPDGLGQEILPKLEKKANKYGDLGAPNVLALWVIDAMANEGTAPLALLGVDIETTPGVHQTGLPLRPDEPGGLWSPAAKHRGRPSAVLAADGFSFNYSATSRVLPHLWLNPRAAYPLTADLPYASSLVSDDQATVENTAATATAAELFGLPEDWPGRPFEARREARRQARAGTPPGTPTQDSA